MSKELSKSYDPNAVEDRIYEFWQNGGYFKACANKDKKPYTIVIPPPNITGHLHMGHALDETLQDILIRFKRMQGYNALWVPGTDHASIATEAKIVEAMREEGLKKEDIGREEFLERAYEWKEKYGGKIIEQIKKLGSSCDWDRERFTMDDGNKEAVSEVFVKLYEKGLVYRGERIINWCPKCKTSISDAEVEFSEHDGNFYHLKYKLADGTSYVELATTRPETLLGDTAIAVNPDDERYKGLVGKKAIVPLIGREIPIIEDSYVEIEFGTGVVKITPAHDPNDFEVGLRHNLPIINVMDEKAVINENGGKYQGLKREDARKKIVEDLKQEGALIKVEPLKHNVGACYRCNEIIEPRVSKQWFVKMEPLAKPAIECVKNGDIRFIPSRFDKIYFNWLNNIKDWCISRQLWWGHRIPAYYCQECGNTMVSKDKITICDKCGSDNVEQDNDTLDTWFSSALWPFATLGWPRKTSDYEYFYPTDTLVTGYDIIFFWVVRMVFSALEHTGKAPFKNVLIHGLVRDSKGRKMSKSLGNGVDPLEIIDRYGTDALRFSLATGNSPGNDMRFSEEKVSASRNFANKIWNAARFIHMNIDEYDVKNEIPRELNIEDKWIISLLNDVTRDATENIEKFELGVAIQKLYDFVWDYFCDWYIELSKIRIQSDEIAAKNTRNVLVYVMDKMLKLLHPFMPFITEEIWQTLPHEGESIMVAEYPKFEDKNCYLDVETEFQGVIEVIKAIRNRRAEMNVAPSRKASVYIETRNPTFFEKNSLFIKKLACAKEVTVGKDFDIKDAVTIVTSNAKVFMPMDELVDKEAEIARLKKELEATQKKLDQDLAKLSNEGFLSRAPQNVIDGVRESAKALSDKVALLSASLGQKESAKKVDDHA